MDQSERCPPSRPGWWSAALTGVWRGCIWLAGRRWLGVLFNTRADNWKTWVAYLAALLALCVALGVLGWRIAPQINNDPEASDQGAYAYMARNMMYSKIPWHTDGVRNPLFPWLTARFVTPDFEDVEDMPEFLVAGQRFNGILAAALTFLLGLYFARILPPVPAWNAAALSGCGALLPIAMFFGAEPLFYFLFFGMWMTGLWLTVRNPLWLYVLFGVLTGLTYLAKPSTAPFVAMVVAMSLGRLVLTFFHTLPPILRALDWKRWRFAVGMLLFAAIHLVMIYPKMQYSEKTFGDPFYNAPKKWFWLEDWDTAFPKYMFVNEASLARFPPGEQPTFANFLARNGWHGAWFKLSDGTWTRVKQLFLPERTLRARVEPGGGPRRVILPFRGFYLVCALGLMVVMAACALPRGAWSRTGPWALPLLLAAGSFAAYTLAYGWFQWIGPGPRYIMSFYIPLLAVSLLAAQRLRAAADLPPADVLHAAAHATAMGFIVPRLVVLLANPEFQRMSYAF